MSAEERKKILQLVADGKINADEAANLMRVLNDEPAEEQIEVLGTASGMGGERSDPSDFEEVRRRAMRWAMIPLWGGILLTVFSAWGMYTIQLHSGINFWFACLGIPLFLGVVLIALAAGGMGARWIYVNVDRSHAPDWPKNITIALPLPLGLVGWFLKTFGSHIKGFKQTTIDEVIMAISLTKTVKEPLIVNVDEGANGERVQVFIG